MCLDRTRAKLFAVLQMYDFSSKSQHQLFNDMVEDGCLRYCKCTIFKQITTRDPTFTETTALFAILQMYDFSSKSQLDLLGYGYPVVVCDTANVRSFNQIPIDGEIKTNVRGIVCNISTLLCALFCMLFCQQKKRCTWVRLLSLYKLNCAGEANMACATFYKKGKAL